MEIEIATSIVIILCVISFLAGFIDSIAGGGGLLLIPSLLMAGIPPQLALGTNKFAAIFGTTTALINFIINKTVIWRIAIIGLLFSMTGAFAGTKCILLLPQNTTELVILIAIPFAAIVTFIPKKEIKSSIHQFDAKEIYLFVPIICFIIGFYDGFFGPGTGTLLILAFYICLRMNLIHASALSKVFNLSSNISSFVTFALAGKVLFKIGAPIALANLAGGYLGSHVAIRTGQKSIKIAIVFALVILFITVVNKHISS
jgi:uncharacterized protein